MPKRRKDTDAPDQLNLNAMSPETWWRCRGIFSANYVERQMRSGQHVPPERDCEDLYNRIKARWVGNYVGLAKQKEAYTRSKFLDQTLYDLGWFFIPETSIPFGLTRKRPDYCLFLDEATEQASAGREALDIFRASATALEAKKVEHPLDQVSRTETPGWFPSQQVQDYLNHARDNTGRFFDWAILTNGNTWRLYSTDAVPDAYFEFHLAHGPHFCSIDDFRLFYALFRPGAFETGADRRCLLDGFREESLTHQEALEFNLRKRVFGVLEDLAEGFYFNPDNGLQKDDLPSVYEASLVFLYRLLFILYAESGGLLPACAFGPSARVGNRYLNEFSLTRFVDKLRNAATFPDDAFSTLYEQLLGLFDLINGTHKDRNKVLGVTRYNGGLFDPNRFHTIQRWRVGDKSLANVLRQLIFVQPAARSRTKHLRISTDETVDFGTLEVRQLGDIYEGLLGGQLAIQRENELSLVDETGRNHQEGVFYTPDWVVRYLVKETLEPLRSEADSSPAVKAALAAQSTEKQQDNSFAHAILALKVVDPAMGSGHFLVRATEYLAEQIVYHPTTRIQTEQIVTNGSNRTTKEEIAAAGRTPVPRGVPQEEAETAYWRRRVVESCIYGVDINPLAVELAKLSLWLTCIAVDQPLSFLDHHLRAGNSLIWADPEEACQPPDQHNPEAKQKAICIGDAFVSALRDAIKANADIEIQASTELEVVKAKGDIWKSVAKQLRPFISALDVWTAALGGLAVNGEAVNAFDFQDLILLLTSPKLLSKQDTARARQLLGSLQSQVAASKASLQPFHWHLEFPAAFYETNGEPKPQGRSGFDAVLGNPPYISIHTSSEELWRLALQRRAGYIEDLYVHFTDLGFRLLRSGGMFGFIVSDTFFTLNSKARMREQLQSNRLVRLGQCDPFNATVDASIFVAGKAPMGDQESVLFVQARYAKDDSTPARELPDLAGSESVAMIPDLETPEVLHGDRGCLRLHAAPIGLYRSALRSVFFEPKPQALELYRRFNEPLKQLVDTWWDRIDTSRRFAQNIEAIRHYHASLSPGDVTLVGLIADGGQGLATADNSRFLGFLEGTPQAAEIQTKRVAWTRDWLANPGIGREFRRLLVENGSSSNHPLDNGAAWEAAVEQIKADPEHRRALGLRKTDLYRIVPPEKIATQEDFDYAWRMRKADLLRRWREEPELAAFWQEASLPGDGVRNRPALGAAGDVSDAEFCWLCRDLENWIAVGNVKRGKNAAISRSVLGLRSSEDYTDPEDAPRVAVIYNGLGGRGQWVPFRKGDPQGNKWTDDEQMYVDWSQESVALLSTSRNARWQGHDYFFRAGVSWTRGANHVPIKAKLLPPGITEVNALKLTACCPDVLSDLAMLAMFNSQVFSFFLKKFLAHTWMAQIGDVKMMPVVIPSSRQNAHLSQLSTKATEAKRLALSGEAPSNELVDFCRGLADELVNHGPRYLRPGAQPRLLASATDCLAIIELAVNWEAEKLYGVEGLGPFDEF